MASPCVQNINSHPLHHRKGILCGGKLNRQTAAFDKAFPWTIMPPNAGGRFKHRGIAPLLHQHPNQKQSVTVTHHLQLYIVSLDTGCHVMWLIWILQHTWSPSALLHPDKSQMFEACTIRAICKRRLLIKWTDNKRHIQQAGMPTFYYAATFQEYLLHADVLP